MKRKLAFALLFVLLICLCAACGGEPGWIYDLPNGYTLHCVDGSVCCEQNGEQALGYGIRAFCTGSRFVGIRRERGTQTGAETDYYLLDTEENEIYSAQDESEFKDLCESLGAADLGDWIDTARRPKGASHN